MSFAASYIILMFPFDLSAYFVWYVGFDILMCSWSFDVSIDEFSKYLSNNKYFVSSYFVLYKALQATSLLA